MNIYISLLFATIRSALRAREDVALENLALRHQLAVMTRSARRPRLGPADRLLWCWLSRRCPDGARPLSSSSPIRSCAGIERRGDTTGHGRAAVHQAGRGSRRRLES